MRLPVMLALTSVASLALAGCGGANEPLVTTTTASVTRTAQSSTTSTASPTSITTTSAAVTTKPPTITLVCAPGGGDYTRRELTIAASGMADFAPLWADKLVCNRDNTPDPLDDHVRIGSSLQRAVLAAAIKAGYKESSVAEEPADSAAESERALYLVYQDCASNDPTDPYVTMTKYSEGQVAELQAWLTLCPNHPQAKAWRRGIAGSTAR